MKTRVKKTWMLFLAVLMTLLSSSTSVLAIDGTGVEDAAALTFNEDSVSAIYEKKYTPAESGYYIMHLNFDSALDYDLDVWSNTDNKEEDIDWFDSGNGFCTQVSYLTKGKEYAVRIYDYNQEPRLDGYQYSIGRAPTKGTLGTVQWSYANATLTVNGTGSVRSEEGYPWGYLENSIQKVVIGKGITEIGEYAFGWLNKLTLVSLPTTIRRLDAMCFNGCKNLSSIANLQYVTYFGAHCLSKTRWTSSHKNANGHVIYHRFLLEYVGTAKKVTIPSGIKTICSGAFSKHNLTGVTMPDSVKRIVDNAFSYTNLIAVKVGSKVVTIDHSAFRNCGSLKSVILPKTIKAIGYNAFYCCPTLKRMKVPKAATKIGIHALGYNDNAELVPGYVLGGYRNTEAQSYANNNKVTFMDCTAPRVTLAKGARGVAVKWNKVTNASAYHIYRRTGSSKKWKEMKTIAKGSTVRWMDTKVKKGMKYTYAVNAVRGGVVTDLSSRKSIIR